MSLQGGQAAQRMARAGASEVVRAFGRRHGSSWSHGGVVQQSAQRYKAENMDKAVAAFARHHNMEVPKRLRDQKSSEEGGGRGMAKSVAGEGRGGGGPDGRADRVAQRGGEAQALTCGPGCQEGGEAGEPGRPGNVKGAKMGQNGGQGRELGRGTPPSVLELLGE
eukprot:CAMPEP_0169482320 /NCGR_PEP_ID=MMETSP1042-20121227/30619_1 /TAXON_ID=464988 /ORGANISM="Hemiselmis andersenii, Strain CCMP1180" /LENGTH=164 /DNA_ID=CAMNT_0009597193 /DNA_START=111 /DNA_END=606 /DNA_ORIENTATION=-